MTETASLVIRTDATQVITGSAALADLADKGEKADRSTKALTVSTEVLVGAAKKLAGAFSLWKVYDYIKDATLLNARYETLGVAMNAVGKNVGYTAAQMEAAAQALQKTGISMLESRSAAMQLVQAHIDLADSTKLARVAQDAAVIGGINSSEAFGRMVHGIQSAQVEVLRTIGINVQFEDGYKKLAAELHKNTTELTDNEKAQSRLQQVLERGKDIAGVYEASMSTASKQILSMKRYTEDAKVQLGELFNEALTVAVMAYTDHLKDTNSEMKKLSNEGDLKAWSAGIADAFAIVADGAIGAISALQTVGATTIWMGNLITDGVQRMKHPFSSPEMDMTANSEAYSAMVKDIWANSDKMRVALANRRAAVAEDGVKTAALEAAKLNQTRSDLQAYAKALEDGILTQEQYVRASGAIMKNAYGDNHFYSDSPTTPKAKANDPYKTLIESIKEKTAADELDLQTQGNLTAGQKEAVKVMEELATGKLKLTNLQKVELTALLERRLAVEQANLADKSANKQAQADMEARVAMRKKESDDIDAYFVKQLEGRNAAEAGANDALKAEQLRADQFGKTRAEIEMMVVKELELKQTRVRADSEEYASLQRQIDARTKLSNLMRQDDARDAEVANWKSMWTSIDSAAHTTFIDIFNGGQDAFTKLGNVLKTSLLDLLYQMTIKKWIFNIAADVSGGSGGSAISSVAGAGSTASGLGTMANIFGVGGAIESGITSVGAAMINGPLSGMLGDMGASLIANSSAIATAIPYVGAAILAVKVLSSAMDYKITANGNALTATMSSSGLPSGQVGTRADFTQVGGLFGGGTTHNSDWGVADASVSNYVDANLKNVTTAAKSFANILGLDAAALDGFTKSVSIDITGMNAAAQQAAIDAAISSFSAEQVEHAFGASVTAYSQAGETASQTLGRLATNLINVNPVLAVLGNTLYDVSTKGAAAAGNLITAFGGLQNFQTQTTGIYNSFYTKDEKRANLLGSASESLTAAGISTNSDILGGASRQDWRAMIDQYSKGRGTTQGDAQYVAVVNAANMLDSVIPPFETAVASVAPAVQAVTQAISGGSGSATGSLVNAFQSLVDSIVSEVQRIKGLTSGNSVLGLAEAQASFSIASAQARAGDKSAAGSLPQLSQALLTVAESQASSLTELNYIRGQTANSLAATGGALAAMGGLSLPSFDGGTDSVPKDMIAMIHKGEKITPAAFNNGGSGGDNSEMVSALTTIQNELRDIWSEMLASRRATERIRDITEKSDAIGPAPARAVA